MKPGCRHQKLHFADGGFHIVCDCGAQWSATDSMDRPLFEAITWGLYPTDLRQDPYYVKPPAIPKHG